VAKLNPPAAEKMSKSLITVRLNYLTNIIIVAIIVSFAEGDWNFWLSSGKPKKYPGNPVNPVQ
jgi:hypothetical protein